MNSNGNGQDIDIDPQELIQALQARISQLIMECAARDAYIGRLTKALEQVADRGSTDGSLVSASDS